MTNKPLTVIQVLPALNGGGVEKGTLEIGHHLSKNSHRSIVVSAGGRLVDHLTQEGSQHICADIGAKKLSTLKYILWFRQLLTDIQPDIIHLRSRLPAWICYMAWKSLPASQRPHFVTTFHGQHSVNRYSKIMACGERVITVSEFTVGNSTLFLITFSPPATLIISFIKLVLPAACLGESQISK